MHTFFKHFVETDQSHIPLLDVFLARYLTYAQTVTVLEGGHIKFHGPPSGYEPSLDLITSVTKNTGQSMTSETKPENESVIEEDSEAPLQKTSQGLVPYTFYARMSTLPQIYFVSVGFSLSL